MSGVDTRSVNRDSLFLMAELRLEGDDAQHRVRVRNLSAGGMMAEGDFRALAGTRVTVTLKNVRPIAGSVAWVHARRVGISFAEEIDPKAPRSAATIGDSGSPRIVRPSSVLPPGYQIDPKRLRNI